MALGDTIRPGRWGGIVQALGATDNLYWREAFWELLRRDVSPNSISRMAALFLWDDLQRARAFAGRSQHAVWEVKMDDPNAAQQRADMVWIDAAVNSLSVDDACRYPKLYWEGKGSGAPLWESHGLPWRSRIVRLVGCPPGALSR